MNQPYFALENLSFKFERKDPFFFKDNSLELAPRTIYFIQGKNGSGKSTLFRILRGNVQGNEFVQGTILLDGKQQKLSNVSQESSVCSQIRMVVQKFDLMLADRFTFEENLQLANLCEYPGISKVPDHQPLPHLIHRFGICKTHPVSLLSGGQRQILAILMALQKPTKILLLDEPTAALDYKNAHIVMDFLKDLIATLSLTILIICHDKELVKDYATDTYFEIDVDETTSLRTITRKSL